MPFFRVVIHGTGITFRIEGSSKPAISFYTSRAVRAGSAEEAVAKAKNSVLAVWATEEYVRANAGGMPVLSTDKVEEVSFWQARRTPTEGHAFYAEK
jgi:hypothetical protein